MATTDILALQQLLSSGASDTGLVKDCLEAQLPVYMFNVRPAAAPAKKLMRVDSFPVVPEYLLDRCDSPPPGSLPPYGLGAAEPLYAHHRNAISYDDLPSLEVPDHPDFAQPSADSASTPVPLHRRLSSGSDSGNTDYEALGAVPDAGGSPLADCDEATSSGTAFAPRPVRAAAVPAAPLARHHVPRRHASDVVRPSGGAAPGPGALDPAACGGAGGGAAQPAGRSVLEAGLVAMWDDRADRGLFRYDVSTCATRVLPGRLGFVAQLNEGRATKKRPTEFKLDQVLQPFDTSKFNFTKAATSEVLLAFQPAFDAAASPAAAAPQLMPPAAPLGAALGPAGPVAAAKAAAAAEGVGAAAAASPHLVMINVSPIDYGHVLLVPRVLDALPQRVDAESVLLSMLFAREIGSPHFRVGYNSLGAFATINHLHFHAYHLPLVLPCERAATVPLPGALAHPLGGAAAATAAAAKAMGLGPVVVGSKRPYQDGAAAEDARASAPGGVLVSRLVGYPVNAFVVEAVGGDDIEAVAGVVAAAAQRLQAANHPFNLLVSDAGRRVFVFPQCYVERQAAGTVPAELLDTGINPASFEIAGHLVIKRSEDYDAADEAWAERLLEQVSLDEARFLAVARMCFGGEGAKGL